MVSLYTMQTKLALFLLITCVLILGCATSEHNTSDSSKTNQSALIDTSKEQEANESVEQLSTQRDVTIDTSQGNLEIEPTVVSATDAAVVDGNDEAKQFKGEYNDPLEPINRVIFNFNHGFYYYVFIPVAKGYDYIVPEKAKDNVDNVFSNLREPLNFVNNVLSLEGKAASRNLGRFLVNSTVGVLGIFDVADHWFDIKPSHRKLDDMLTSYSVGDGPYIVLPVFGPSDVKSSASTILEGLFHPVNLAISSPESTSILVTNGVHDFSYQVELYETLRAQSEDPYIYFRNQHIQAKNRDEIAREKQKGQWFKRKSKKD